MIGNGEESWIKRSAIKILQDIDDAKQFDLPKYLPCLKHIETPNGEELSVMQKYQEIFPWMYSDLSKYDIAIAAEMWEKFGVGEPIAAKMKSAAEKYSSEAQTMSAVRELYSRMLKKAPPLISG
jgi:hypothetical protein